MIRSLTAPQAVVDRLTVLVVEAVASTPSGLGRWMAETVAQYRDVIRTHNIPLATFPWIEITP